MTKKKKKHYAHSMIIHLCHYANDLVNIIPFPTSEDHLQYNAFKVQQMNNCK